MSDLILNPGGPHSPEYARQVAGALAEAVRLLHHATGSHAAEALHEPADVDAVVQELAIMAQRLPQLCHQIVQWLLAQDAASRLEVRHGEHAGEPWQAVAVTQGYLVDAAVAADALGAALDAARQVTATIGAPYDPEEDPDA